MNDETILQVKVRRKDIYDAVRNLLLNEFKVIPEDLLKTVDQKIDNRLDIILEKRYGTYFDGVRTKIDAAIAKKITLMETEIEKIYREAATKAIQEMLTKDVVKNMMAKFLESK